MRLIDRAPRPGAQGALVAFIHPSSAHGVLVELKQTAASRRNRRLLAGTVRHARSVRSSSSAARRPLPPGRRRHVRRRAEAAVGAAAPADDRNRIRLAMRPLLVRGERTMLIDAGVGDKMDAKSRDIYAHRSPRPSTTALADAGLGRRHRHRARDAPAFRSRRRLHAARRDGALRAAVPARPLRHPRAASGKTRRIRTSATAPAIAGELRAAARGRRGGFRRRRRRDHARRAVVPDRRAHQAPPDRLHRVRRQDGGVRGGPDPDHGASRERVDHGLRPLSDGHARVQADVHPRSDRPRIPDLLRARSRRAAWLHPREDGAVRRAVVRDRTQRPRTSDELQHSTCPSRSASSAAAACTTWPN